MNKQKLNQVVNESLRLEKLINRHKSAKKIADKEIQQFMIKNNLDVFQGDNGVVTYKKTTSNKTIIDLFTLFTKLKISLFLKLVVFNATLAKPLVKSGELDQKILDSVTSTDTKTTPAKLKILAK